jgi:hypothetical protein
MIRIIDIIIEKMDWMLIIIIYAWEIVLIAQPKRKMVFACDFPKEKSLLYISNSSVNIGTWTVFRRRIFLFVLLPDDYNVCFIKIIIYSLLRMRKVISFS